MSNLIILLYILICAALAVSYLLATQSENEFLSVLSRREYRVFVWLWRVLSVLMSVPLIGALLWWIAEAIAA